ncbi:hypothetical protein ACLS0F_06785 [Avibacterium endocarditidis]|uniref:hypothetical protein n=1 Tax=Avibacterium endocarditidis TaxID=380674 RepID=UPI003BF860D7
MKKLLIAVLLMFGLISCSDEEVKPSPTPQEQIRTKESFAKYVGAGVSYDVNDRGVLIFEKPRQMFANFNDYRESEKELVFVSENPLSVRISKKVQKGDKMAKQYSEIAFVYAIYRTFMNTSADLITVESYPIEISAKGKEKPLKQFTLKATVSRDKALNVLKQYTDANSFDDLIQLKENKEYRTIGVDGSELWDKFIYNDRIRPDVVQSLMNN